LIVDKPVIIIGAGDHAGVLISSLKALGREIIGILNPDKSLIGHTVDGICILGDDDKIKDYSIDSINLVNGIGSITLPAKRKDIYVKFRNDGYSFVSVIHPSATIIDYVKIDEGVQIMAGAIVQTGCTIAENVIINTGAIVDHDCKIGPHVHIASGAVLSGCIKIGAMSHIGTGATIVQGIKIGDDVIVGAGAVVIKDIPHGKKVVGNPARIVE
jgi:sugar O-acyltransferase (sialic acid O-acetyltransferase NeuD family)